MNKKQRFIAMATSVALALPVSSILVQAEPVEAMVSTDVSVKAKDEVIGSQTSEFHLSIKNTENLANIEITLETNGSDITVNGKNGFVAITDESTVEIVDGKRLETFVLAYTKVPGSSLSKDGSLNIASVSVDGEFAELTIKEINGTGFASDLVTKDAQIDISKETAVYGNEHDVNGDGIVDLKDITEVQKYLGETSTGDNWAKVSRYDMNEDELIDVSDLTEIFLNFGNESDIATTIVKPAFDVSGGSYTQAQTVSISSSTSDVKIYYTLDGTTPTAESNLYINPIEITETTTLKAVAIDTENNVSKVTSATYTIESDTSVEHDYGWELVWSDEFDGTAVDETKWEFQIGTKAEGGPEQWGNQEEQYYTKENSSVADGMLTITAKEESIDGMSYTSSRLWTEPTYSTTYGRIEARMSLPEGDGYWPAFWMLPVDTEEYGGWAAGGEIDIMEARGRLPDHIGGTIHYGEAWPNNVYSGGEYFFPEGEDITGFHTYAVEWEPGEIRWYVDGNLYHVENDWYSKDGNEETEYAYPAPFDQEFYIILNLAVGGTYDGMVTPDSEDVPGEMVVDYVRVYEASNGYVDHTKPTYEKDEYPESGRQFDENGSLIHDYDLLYVKPVTAEEDITHAGWNLMTGNGGVASVERVADETKVEISNGGSQNYSVQLLDYFPLAQGRYYKLTFDAKADSDRSITAQFGAGAEKGWNKYSESFGAKLSTDWETYSYEFQMTADTYEAARLELNLGQSDVATYFRNVTLVEIDTLTDTSNDPKAPLEDGNHIYNGKFDKGDGRVEFWNDLTTVNEEKQAVINGEISQTGINLLHTDEYKLSFDLEGEVTVSLESKTGEVYATKTIKQDSLSNVSLDFAMNQATDEEAIIKFTGTALLDNVVMLRTTNNNLDWNDVSIYPLQNGDFSADLSNWEGIAIYGYEAKFDVTGSDKVATIDVLDLGDDPWNTMFMNAGLSFTKGFTYDISFDIWADNARDAEFVLEGPSYRRDMNEIINITTEKQTIHYTFTSTTDDLLDFKFLLGNTANGAIGKVYIDNVKVSLQDAPIKEAPSIAADTLDNNLGNDIVLAHSGDQAWVDAVTAIKVNGVEVTYVIDANSITLDKNLFTTEGSYEIEVIADAYTSAKLDQMLYSSSGNIVLNGDFTTDLAAWDFYSTQTDHSNVKINNKMAEIEIHYNGGVTTEWGDPVAVAWNTQFFQDEITLEANKTYTISFDAQSLLFEDGTEAKRPIKIEIKGVGLAENAKIINITGDMNHYSFEVTPTADVVTTLNFLLGNVIDGENTTLEAPHIIRLDQISIVEKDDSKPTDPVNPPVDPNPSTATEIGATAVLFEAEDIATISETASYYDGGVMTTEKHQFYVEFDVNILEAGSYRYQINYTSKEAGIAAFLFHGDEMLGIIPDAPTDEFKDSTWTNVELPAGECTLRLAISPPGIESPEVKLNSFTIEKIS